MVHDSQFSNFLVLGSSVAGEWSKDQQIVKYISWQNEKNEKYNEKQIDKGLHHAVFTAVDNVCPFKNKTWESG